MKPGFVLFRAELHSADRDYKKRLSGENGEFFARQGSVNPF
jgi:hypothetical protein